MTTTLIHPPTGDVTAPTSKRCACGCGAAITSKVNYRPGHDARHISTLVDAATKAGFTDSVVTNLTKQLPTVALAAKFGAALDRAILKDSARKEREYARILRRNTVNAINEESAKRHLPLSDNAATIKIGRWTYPTNPLDPTFRNTQRDGSGEWVKIDGSDTLV